MKIITIKRSWRIWGVAGLIIVSFLGQWSLAEAATTKKVAVILFNFQNDRSMPITVAEAVKHRLFP